MNVLDNAQIATDKTATGTLRGIFLIQPLEFGPESAAFVRTNSCSVHSWSIQCIPHHIALIIPSDSLVLGCQKE